MRFGPGQSGRLVTGADSDVVAKLTEPRREGAANGASAEDRTFMNVIPEGERPWRVESRDSGEPRQAARSLAVKRRRQLR